MIEKEDFKKALKDRLNSHLSIGHPIFADLFAEKRNTELLQLMSLQGYHLAQAFLSYIEKLFYSCPLEKHKTVLLHNLYEEFTGRISKTKNHVELMVDFVNAVGISTDEAKNSSPLEATKILIDYRMDMVHNESTYHIGAAAVLIASEGQSLETRAGESKHTILEKFYGLTNKDTLFFSVHQHEDIAHVNQGIRLVADLCTTEKMQIEALDAVDKTCTLFYEMYEGVSREYKKRNEILAESH